MSEPRIFDAELISRVERLLGAPIVHHHAVQGGYTPALRLICETRLGRCFVKIGSTPLVDSFIQREMSVYQRLKGPFMPTLLAYDDSPEAPILITEEFSMATWPPPWQRHQVILALEQIEVMHATPAPHLEPFATVHPQRELGWQRVAADPAPFLALGLADAAWLEIALPDLLDYEQRCRTTGSSLCHWDLRSDNMCFIGERAVIVDWNLACLSNPRLDLAFWLPSLAYEGGPSPEQLLPDAPEEAAWVSGFFAARAGLPPVPNGPRVRLVQRQQLEIALPWVAHTLDLPLP